MKILFSQLEQDNRVIRLAIDTTSNTNASEECIITTPKGLTVSVVSGRKKKAELFPTFLKKVISYIEFILTLKKIIFSLLLLYPLILQ